MKIIWIHIKFKLVDPQHKKPDRTRIILITPAMILDELLVRARGIEALINEGYVIEEMKVTDA